MNMTMNIDNLSKNQLNFYINGKWQAPTNSSQKEQKGEHLGPVVNKSQFKKFNH